MFTTDFRPFLISLSGRFPDKKVRIIRPAEYTFYSGCNYLHFNLLYTYILLDPDLCEPVSNLQLPVLLHQVEAVPGQRVEVAVRHPVQALHGHKYALTHCCSNLLSWNQCYGLDPDSGVFRIQGLQKRSKIINDHNIILLFSDCYNILSFNWLLLMRKSYYY